MIIINFTHPLTPEQQTQIAHLTGQPITAVHDTPSQFDNDQPFPPQINDMLDNVPLNAAQWQTVPLLINPPAYAPIALTLIAELHGRIGHFPTIIRIRPIADTSPTQYEVAEVLNLQKIREDGRKLRQSSIKNRQS
ncbi:hypothetical protein MNBD_CHLOROFLEXI01-4965 [hydrothermal vent metagenome]|uniref:Uncharacterized protein n=1 Tax=hydrothermal vent metagenome TaxID=652676 RepID=A0A3B0UTF2_9ZZZZ